MSRIAPHRHDDDRAADIRGADSRAADDVEHDGIPPDVPDVAVGPTDGIAARLPDRLAA